MIERKLGNDELKAFFRLIPYMGWDVLSWNMDDMDWEHGSGETYRKWHPIYHTDIIKPSEQQAYVIIDLTRPATMTKESILLYFGLHESRVFDRLTSGAYDGMYGMKFTFRPEIEEQILQILAEKRDNVATPTP